MYKSVYHNLHKHYVRIYFDKILHKTVVGMLKLLKKVVRFILGFNILACSVYLSPILCCLYLLKYIEESFYLTFFHVNERNDESTFKDDVRTWLLVVDGTLDLLDVQDTVVSSLVDAHCEDGILRYPNLSRVLKRGFFNEYWKDESRFVVNDHVYVFEGETFYTVHELRKIILQLTNEVLPDHLSPWRIVVVPLPNENTGLIFQCHSSLNCIEILQTIVEGKEISDPDINSSCLFAGGFILFFLNLCFSCFNLCKQFIKSRNQHSQTVDTPEGTPNNLSWTRPTSEIVVRRIATHLKVGTDDVILGCMLGSGSEELSVRIDSNQLIYSTECYQQSCGQYLDLLTVKTKKEQALFEKELYFHANRLWFPNYLTRYFYHNRNNAYNREITRIPLENTSKFHGHAIDLIVNCTKYKSVNVCATISLGNIVISTTGMNESESKTIYNEIDDALKMLAKRTGTFPCYYS